MRSYQQTLADASSDPSSSENVVQKDENSSEVPDYVDKVGEYLEKSLKYQTEDLGFAKPKNVPEFNVLITSFKKALVPSKYFPSLK